MALENFGSIYSDELITATELNRQPGRVFPLKGKLYKGTWEYEVTKGDRVFYYAGKHPSPAPIL